MVVESNEYSKSESDQAAAVVEETAFAKDQQKLDPEKQRELAAKESQKVYLQCKINGSV